MATVRSSIILVIASFIINAIEMGTFKSFGVLLLSMEDSLETTNASLGFTMSFGPSIGYIFGPFIIVAIKVIGERKMIIIAGIMCSIGLVASALVTETWMLVISLSLVGFGNGMAYIASIVLIAKHFTSDVQTTAIGVSSSGGAVGIMIFPPFAEYLQQMYGWRGVLLIFGAINANILVCGAIMQSTKVYHALNSYEDVTRLKKTSSVSNTATCTCITSIKNKLASILEPFSIIKETPIFTTFIMAKFLSGIVYAGWTIFLMPHAILKGIPPLQSALLSSVGGIGAIIGRLTPGPIIDNGYITGLQFGVINNLVNAVAYLLDPLSNSFWSLSILALINGYVFGSDIVIVLPVCAEILQDSEDVINAYGIAFIPSSVGRILGGVLMGYFLDIGVGWFLFLTTTSACCALMFAIPLIVFKWNRKKSTGFL